MGGHGARLGAHGEDIAAGYLEAAGMRVLARNWRYSGPELRGELDLVARDGRCLVICEVKARRGMGAGGPLAAITPRKLGRLRRLAGAYLAASGERPAAMRIDVVGVCWPAGGGPPEVSHLRGLG